MRKLISVAVIASLLSGGVVAYVASLTNHRNSNLKVQRASDELTNKLVNDPVFIASIRSRAEQVTESSVTTIKGDKGEPGEDGRPGAIGLTGADGISGQNGIDGANGRDGPQGPKGDKGEPGIQGSAGATGAQGIQGLQGDPGPKGDTGATGVQGIQGEQGLQGLQGLQGIPGESGVVTVSATGLSYDSLNQDISLASGYNIPLNTSTNEWDTAYSWGNHADAGYAVLAGRAGGQTLRGGTNANNTLVIQANSATSGNTSTNPGIYLRVGDSGSIHALVVRNDGNVGIGTTTPGGKLTVAGDITITTHGSDSIKPFQFVQVAGLTDNPSITSFSGTAYSVADWNPAVVGFSSGGSCGVNWETGARGFMYWWDQSNGNWRLNIDINAPNDGCNSVQVMFVRKELSARTNYGF